MIFRVPYEQAKVLLESWLKWARRCRIEPFVKLARTITYYYRQDVEATLLHGSKTHARSRPTRRSA